MADREEISVSALGTLISHYTHAVRVGDLLFVSGCVPTDADGNVVGGDDVAAQARKVFENIGAILAAAGATFADVAKVTVYLTDISLFQQMNGVYTTYFKTDRPARATVQVASLNGGSKVEIVAIARKPAR